MEHKDTAAVTNQPSADELTNKSWKDLAKVFPLLSCLMVTADGAHMTSPAAVCQQCVHHNNRPIHADILFIHVYTRVSGDNISPFNTYTKRTSMLDS